MQHYIDPLDINNPNQQPSNPLFITFFTAEIKAISGLLCCFWEYSIIEIENRDGQ